MEILTHLILILLTFILGWVLHGGVAWPSWSMSAPDFNLINNITFVMQMGAGLPALASLTSSILNYSPLGGIPQHPFYELGSYYLLVGGAINYFALCNLWDRCVTPQPRFEEQETGQPPIGDKVNRQEAEET